MGKVLTWVLIGLILWGAWRLYTISQRRSERARRDAGAVPPGDGRDAGGEPARVAAPEAMVRCAVCGVHLPGSEARWSGGRTYCGDAHRDEALAARARGGRDDD